MTVQPTPESRRDRRRTPPPPPTLEEVAQQCLEGARDTDNVVQEATTAMLDIVRNNDALFRALFTESQVRQACYNIVRALVHRQRGELWSTPQPSDEATRSALDSHAGLTMRRTLMEFRLWNGKPLGDSTKAEVLAAAQRWIKQGNSMVGTGRWLELVGNACPDTGVVKDRLNEQDLARFRQQIDNPTPPRGRGRRRS